VYGARFWKKNPPALEDAIELHAFAPLEALACVCYTITSQESTFLTG
jgi:hypothetical protein